MQKKRRDMAFVLPAVVVVAIMTQVPFLLTLVYSTLRWNLARPDLPVRFTGIDNYLFFLRMPNFPEAPRVLHNPRADDLRHGRRPCASAP